jgi:hypothetical protein
MTGATMQTPKPNEINGENRRAGFRRTASPGPLLTRHLHRHRLLRASSFAFSRCDLEMAEIVLRYTKPSS